MRRQRWTLSEYTLTDQLKEIFESGNNYIVHISNKILFGNIKITNIWLLIYNS